MEGTWKGRALLIVALAFATGLAAYGGYTMATSGNDAGMVVFGAACMGAGWILAGQLGRLSHFLWTGDAS